VKVWKIFTFKLHSMFIFSNTNELCGLDPTFFPGRCAEVIVHGKSIGKLGVLHPRVVENFDCNMPCAALEIEIEGFL